MERGAKLPAAAPEVGPDVVVLRQRVSESARSFASRVATRLRSLREGQVHVKRAELNLGSSSELSIRIALARAILCLLPAFQTELLLSVPVGASIGEQRDLHALCDVLDAQLSGSGTTVRAVS